MLRAVCCGEWGWGREGGAAHLAGRNRNLPEAAGNRPELGEGQRLAGQPRALPGTTGPSQPRLEAKAPQGASRHQLCVQLQLTPRLQAYVYFLLHALLLQQKRSGNILKITTTAKNIKCLVSKASRLDAPFLYLSEPPSVFHGSASPLQGSLSWAHPAGPSSPGPHDTKCHTDCDAGPWWPTDRAL